MCLLRTAGRDDAAAMHRVRLSVKENVLRPGRIVEADVIPAIETTGRGWVIDCGGDIVAFAVGNKMTGNIWALFVRPDHEARGHGTRLHDAMLDWLWAQGLERLWLTTDPGTRAQTFYERKGWTNTGPTEDGELLFEMLRMDKH